MTRPIPPDFVEVTARLGNSKKVRAHYRVGSVLHSRWVRLSGIQSGHFFKNLRPMPDDFAEHAPNLRDSALAKLYSTGIGTVGRWRHEAGDIPEPAASRRPVPADFAAICPTLSLNGLCDRYHATAATVRRWMTETGVRQKVTIWTGLPRVNLPAADVSMAGRAAQHLRRFYSPVYRAEILPLAERKSLPGAGKNMFVVGNKGALPATEIIALAEAKGFDSRAWARL